MKRVVISPSGLLSLNDAVTDDGGECLGDRCMKKALVARGLAKWRGKQAMITKLGKDLLVGKVEFDLGGSSTQDFVNKEALDLARQIRGEWRPC